jgi:hypothetical protein
MKIYAVVDNVDLGYHVEFATLHKDKAQEALNAKVKQWDDYLIEQRMLDGETYDEAKEYVDNKSRWSSYEMIEIEVEE